MGKGIDKKQITSKEILNKIISSKKEDWEKFRCEGYSEVPPGYEEIAYYKPDRSISLAWWFLVEKDFKQDWAKKFPGKTASSYYLGVFYNKNLVHKDIYVEVDDYRAMLPLPVIIDNELFVTEDQYNLIRKFNEIYAYASESSFDQYFIWANFKIIPQTKNFNKMPPS